MGKKKEMLKCFFKVITNNESETNKIIPDMYAENFYKIDIDFLLNKGINNLILDIDGTLMEVDSTYVSEELVNHINLLKSKNINMCLVSNNGNERVLPVSEKLGLKYLANAGKPLKEAFDKAMDILNTNDKKSVAMVGDQMMSDIKGANEYGIYSILVKSISKHDNIQTGTSRFLQNIMEKHLKKINKFDKDVYYKKGM